MFILFFVNCGLKQSFLSTDKECSTPNGFTIASKISQSNTKNCRFNRSTQQIFHGTPRICQRCWKKVCSRVVSAEDSLSCPDASNSYITIFLEEACMYPKVLSMAGYKYLFQSFFANVYTIKCGSTSGNI